MLASTAQGAVLAVFERSAYLDIGGRIVALASVELGQGPLTIAVGPFERLRPLAPGDAVTLEDGLLRVGPHSVELSGAPVWDPTLHHAGGRVNIDPGPAALDTVVEELARGTRSASVVALLNAPPAGAVEDPLPAALRRGLRAIGDFLSGRAGADDVASAVARELAGRGPGLTPSGDDLLTGIMHAMTTWPQIASSMGGRRVHRLLADAARPHTTRISGAYLDAAAAGQAIEPWHAVIRSLTRAPAALRGAARRLMAVGETSGTDALTGFCWAWRRLAL